MAVEKQRDKYGYRENFYTVKNKDELKQNLEDFFQKDNPAEKSPERIEMIAQTNER